MYSCVGLYPKNVEHLVLETGTGNQETDACSGIFGVTGIYKRSFKELLYQKVEERILLPDGGSRFMAHYLVIVESPAKVKTIKKFLEVIIP